MASLQLPCGVATRTNSPIRGSQSSALVRFCQLTAPLLKKTLCWRHRLRYSLGRGVQGRHPIFIVLRRAECRAFSATFVLGKGRPKASVSVAGRNIADMACYLSVAAAGKGTPIDDMARSSS